MKPKELLKIHPQKKTLTVMGVHFDLNKKPPEKMLIRQAQSDAQKMVREYQLKTLLWLFFSLLGIFLSLYFKEYYGLFIAIPCVYASFICCDYSVQMQHANGLCALLSERKGPIPSLISNEIIKNSLLQDYFFNINERQPVFAEERLFLMKIQEEKNEICS